MKVRNKKYGNKELRIIPWELLDDYCRECYPMLTLTPDKIKYKRNKKQFSRTFRRTFIQSQIAYGIGQAHHGCCANWTLENGWPRWIISYGVDCAIKVIKWNPTTQITQMTLITLYTPITLITLIPFNI